MEFEDNYNGDDLLVGFGEPQSDEDSSIESVKLSQSHESHKSFFGRLIGKERKGQINRRDGIHQQFNSISSHSFASSSVQSAGSRDFFLKNVGKAFQKFNRHSSDSILEGQNEGMTPIVLYDMNKHDALSRNSSEDYNQHNPIREDDEHGSNEDEDIELSLGRMNSAKTQQRRNSDMPHTDMDKKKSKDSNVFHQQELDHQVNISNTKYPLHEAFHDDSIVGINVKPNIVIDDLSYGHASRCSNPYASAYRKYSNENISINDSSSMFKQKKAMNRKNVIINPTELQSYIKKNVKKSNETKQMLYDAIKSNILFILWTHDEIFEFIDAFEELNIEEGETIFNEGDEGAYFYVLESGSVNVYKQFSLAGSIDGCGVTFGDVALLYDAPRNATFCAVTACKLWVIDRKDYRGISRLNNKSKADQKISFIKEVKIGKHVMGDVLEMSEIYNIALATQNVTFEKGDYIIKEGDRGDTFFIIKKGFVEVYIEGFGDKPVSTMGPGQFIGEKAILQLRGVRTATCVVTSDVVECLSLEKDAFTKMLGDVKWMFENLYEKQRVTSSGESSKGDEDEKIENKILSFDLSNFEINRTIGIGAFGSVKLAKSKSISVEDNVGIYVLKCQDLKLIEKNNMKEHIKREQEILQELNHPFIIKFYGAVDDSKYKYFLLELLQGGELFRLLLEKNSFPESWSRFYSGIVLSAFSEIHSKNFVYRDLKPENLVLDNKGYAKIVDFGLAKRLEGGKTWTLCGTPDYMPPEIILNEGHDSAADYWSVGILLYEFSTGSPPFTSEYPMDVYKNILSGNVMMPAFFSPQLQDLIKKLLNPRQATRIGRTYGGTKSIMNQDWFASLNFEDLLERKIDPPFVPELSDENDMKYFYDYSDFDADKQYEDKIIKGDAHSRKSSVTFDEEILNFDSKGLMKSHSKRSFKVDKNDQQMLDVNTEEISRQFSIRRMSSGSSYVPYQPQRAKADSFLMIQLMNLALSENMSELSKRGVSFKQFSLLSLTPETLYDLAASSDLVGDDDTVSFNGSRFYDPIYMHSVDVVDSFPKEKRMKRRSSASHLAPEALAAFCFPNGLSIRLLPRCAVEGAKRLKWIGKDSDTYQLHAFTNASGGRSYGVAITIKEEIYSTDDEELDTILHFLKRCQIRRRAARKIREWWLNICQTRTKSSEHFDHQNDEKKNFFSRAIHFAERKHKNTNSTVNIAEKIQKTLMRSQSHAVESHHDEAEEKFRKSWSFDDAKSPEARIISPVAKRLAAEAFKFMNEADIGGDVCIIEHCYIMMGTKPEEQSLMLAALQKVIDVEREDKAVRMRFAIHGNAINPDSTSLFSENRNAILHAMQTKLYLSPDHKKTIFSRGKVHKSFEVDLSLGNSSKITLPLPLPHMSSEWGFATLIRSISIQNVFLALKLLLIERSILLIGTSAEEVSASACAMSDLLKPFKWASAFMPLLPVKLLDIVESPVPFIAGIVLKDEASLDTLEQDERVNSAMEEGMSIINLTSKTFSPTSEDGVIDFMRRCNDPVSHVLNYYEKKLDRLMKTKSSSLTSFKSFFQNGASLEESKILDCMRDVLEEHFEELSCISKPDDYKKFGVFDPETREFDFFPDKFLEPLKAQLEFQENMITTQYFLTFFEDKKKKLDILEGPSAQFIAGWIYRQWKKRKQNEDPQIDETNESELN